METERYVVVGNGNEWYVEVYDPNLNHQHDSPFGELWLEKAPAQMVADIANTLDAETLKKFIYIMDT